MTNKEAITELEELVIKQARIGLFNVEVEALEHAIEVIKRFDGAVIAHGKQINSDTHDLYAIPKEN